MRSFFLVIVALMVAADLLWWRLADRRVRRLTKPRRWRAAVAAFVACQLAMLLWVLFARFVSPRGERMAPSVLVAATYLWHLLILPTTLLAHGFHWSTGAAWRKLRPLLTARTVPTTADGLTRRQFFGVAGPPVFTALAVGGSMRQVRTFRIRQIDVPIAGLPSDLHGLRIAHVTDLHVGRFTYGATLRRVVEQTNQLNADLVLLTGDLVNNNLADLPEALAAVKNMQSRYGSYMCLGNHDLIDRPREFIRRTKEAGVALLVNEAATLDVRGRPVQLLGTPWEHADAAFPWRVDTLLRQRTPEAFPILLAHHPHTFDAAAAAGLPLTLSGHTHGGQLMLNDHVGIGPMMFRYWSGLYRGPRTPPNASTSMVPRLVDSSTFSVRPSDAALVVSNGVGNWFPLRVHAAAEILDLRLVSA